MLKRNYVERAPRKWKVEENGVRLSEELGGETLVKVDYNCVAVYMSMYVRKSIYNKLLSGKYTVSPNCSDTLIILDEKGIVIEPITKDLFY